MVKPSLQDKNNYRNFSSLVQITLKAKMTKKKHILTFVLVAVNLVIFAGPPPPPPPGVGPGCWPPPCVPIDGGITLLMAAGAAYGAKKIYDSKKKRDTAE